MGHMRAQLTAVNEALVMASVRTSTTTDRVCFRNAYI